MCKYKAEMKCTGTAESSRMKLSVQLGLLCLSLLICSLHGEVETDNSMQLPVQFEEPDLDQPEMYRVRRQAVSTDKLNNRKQNERKKPHPGAASPLRDTKDFEVQFSRTKRQIKNKNKQKKNPPRPGHYSVLAMGIPQIPQIGRAKRDNNVAGHLPGR